jgi:nitrite reductase (NADH) small subunit
MSDNQPQNEPQWNTVGAAADWKPDSGKLVQIGPRRIGVYFYKDSWYALKDICPHAGVSLVVGPIHDGAVMCVGHGWRFKLASGELLGAPPNTYKVATFPVRVVDGKVEVAV